MIKSKELTDPNSCMSRAKDDEMTFVLLGRDAAAPVAIRAWIEERVRLGKNRPMDPQIIEAWECALRMEEAQGVVIPCDDCKGSGRDRLGPDLSCPKCWGSGKMRVPQGAPDGQ